MSAVITTATPFTLEVVLLNALHAIGAEPQQVTPEMLLGLSQRNQVQVGDIITNRSDYNGRQLFRLQNERWVLLHDGDEFNTRVVSQMKGGGYTKVSQFLSALNTQYDIAYQQYLEEIAEQERIRLEQERKARIEATKLSTIEKAKSQGYSVKESLNNKGQIQLVLTRTVS